MNKKIIMKHRSEGGTALTNFLPNQFNQYLEAVRRFGDSRFVVVNDPIPPMTPGSGGSLHSMTNEDNSSFWETFRAVQEEMLHTDKSKEAEIIAAEIIARAMKK